MTLTTEIQTAIKSNKAVVGYKKSIKNIKLGNVGTIIMASNIDENMKKELEHNAKIAAIKIKVFDGTSKELGTICGKPFPISTILIRG